MRALRDPLRALAWALTVAVTTGPALATRVLYVPADHPAIQAALDAAGPGDTVRVAPGVYRESLDIGAHGVVLEAAAVAYHAALPERADLARTVIDGGGGDYVIRVAAGGGPLTVRGFTLRNADDGITPERPLTVTHCRITATADGIDYEGGGGLVEWCYFEGNRDDGIDLDGPTAVTIRGNQIVGNGDDGIEVRFHPYQGDSLVTRIEGNHIAGNGEDGIHFIDYEEATPRRFRVEGNLIVDNDMAGIAFMADANTREDYQGDHVEERVEVVHNTIAGNAWGITGGGNLWVANTIIAGHRLGALKNADVVEHVLLWDNGVDTVGTSLGGTVRRGDPRLSGDGRLRPGSAAIDAGRPLPSRTFAGAAPDLGAFEYSAADALRPVAVTAEVSDDSDDPAIWIDRQDPGASRILGTDKGGHLYVFDLRGRVLGVHDAPAMRRLNNVDVEYGLRLGGDRVDIAVASDRDAGLLWAWSLPDMRLLTPGGVPAFAGEPEAQPMGLALYRRPADGAVFAIVSRKWGPSGEYLWQYRLADDGAGNLTFREVRRFGRFSGVDAEDNGEIEAVSVDDSAGVVYYSDELDALRAYRADPDDPRAGELLEVFGRDGFHDDREGIAIARQGDGGLLVVSDQGANRFRAYELGPGHAFVGSVHLQASSTDGCEVYPGPLPGYPGGLFVAMSDDRTFQLYDWGAVRAALRGPPR